MGKERETGEIPIAIWFTILPNLTLTSGFSQIHLQWRKRNSDKDEGHRKAQVQGVRAFRDKILKLASWVFLFQLKKSSKSSGAPPAPTES